MKNLLFSFILFFSFMTDNTYAAATSITIKPHRAYYSISLKSSNSDSEVKDTTGKMVLELKHDCAGWTLKQDSASVIELKASQEELMRSSYLAWESEDGKTLRFQTERVYNDAIEDSIGGIAGFSDKGGNINYTTPETTFVKMPPGTLPPIAHMKKLLETAVAGEGSNSGQVFDGSFYGNPVQINTFIGPKKTNCSNQIKDQAVWPMNLAVYAMPSNDSNPNFEITQNMTRDGVMCSYTINFGDYSVKGQLDKIEYLPEKACRK